MKNKNLENKIVFEILFCNPELWNLSGYKILCRLIRLSTCSQNISVWNWKKEDNDTSKKNWEKLEVNIKLCADLYCF
jgi:hypothetical protein